MKYAIVFSSPTGNTKILAEAIKQNMSGDCCYFGEAQDAPLEADYLFVGFWTDKGQCDEPIQHYLEKLQNQKIFLFGTAGYGGSQEYFEGILTRVKNYIPQSNQIMGQFMCQGKMPMSVRQRYEKMAEDNPERFLPMIQNFDLALEHPNQQDIENLIHQIQAL